MIFGSKVWVADSPANPRHLNHLLWLLPSGSDQVNKLSMRGTKKPTIVTVIKCCVTT